jgi:hypothetical protein
MQKNKVQFQKGMSLSEFETVRNAGAVRSLPGCVTLATRPHLPGVRWFSLLPAQGSPALVRRRSFAGAGPGWWAALPSVRTVWPALSP